MDDWNATARLPPDPPAPDRALDAATLVSIGSSCVILISGAIAVVCLIVYMKKSEQQMQSLRQMPPHVPHALSVCAKCGATVAVARFEAKTTPDDAKDDARPPTTPHVEHVMPESALYAISGQDFGEKSARAPEGFLGVILGHVAEELDAVYSAESNPLARGGASGARIHCSASQCSSAPDSEVARIALRWPELEPEHALYASVASGQDTPTDPGIRQFTESPPAPNERRWGRVERAPDLDLELDRDLDLGFGALPRQRSRRPTWKLETRAQTLQSRSALDQSEPSSRASSPFGQQIHC